MDHESISVILTPWKMKYKNYFSYDFTDGRVNQRYSFHCANEKHTKISSWSHFTIALFPQLHLLTILCQHRHITVLLNCCNARGDSVG